MFTSRIDRLGFFLGHVYLVLPIVVVIIVYAFVGYLMSMNGADQEFGPVRSGFNVMLFMFGAASILLYWPVSISLMIRRWHDMNQTGWLTILSFLPFIGSIIFFVQLFASGTNGPNDHGIVQSPRGFVEVLFGSRKSDPATSQQADIASPTILPPGDRQI